MVMLSEKFDFSCYFVSVRSLDFFPFVSNFRFADDFKRGANQQFL